MPPVVVVRLLPRLTAPLALKACADRMTPVAFLLTVPLLVKLVVAPEVSEPAAAELVRELDLDDVLAAPDVRAALKD